MLIIGYIIGGLICAWISYSISEHFKRPDDESQFWALAAFFFGLIVIVAELAWILLVSHTSK